MKKIILALIVFALFVVVAKTTTFASQQFSQSICHHTPGNAVTLTFHTPQAYAGHLGQPHSGSTFDTLGTCPANTPTPTVVPTSTPIVTPTPKKSCDTEVICLRECEPTVTPTPELSVTPTDVPTGTPSATLTPTDGPIPTTPPSPHGDGLSDGHESGHIDVPSAPKAPPATGRGR